MKNKYLKIVIITFLILIFAMLLYTIFYLYNVNKVQIMGENNFFIEIDENEDISQIATKWVEKYLDQYKQKYIPTEQRIKNYEIKETQILDEENKIVQVDFNVYTNQKYAQYFLDNNFGGYSEQKTLKCQWVLDLLPVYNINLQKNICYIKGRRQRAAYDMEQYKLSGQADIDEEKGKYDSKKEYEDKNKQCTYKIENGKIYLTYDNSNTWKEVITDINIIDSTDYKLEEGLYQISEEITLLSNKNGDIIYSTDKAESWQELEYKENKQGIFYIKFLNRNTGYIVTCEGAAIGGTRAIAIYITNDGRKNMAN